MSISSKLLHKCPYYGLTIAIDQEIESTQHDSYTVLERHIDFQWRLSFLLPSTSHSSTLNTFCADSKKSEKLNGQSTLSFVNIYRNLRENRGINQLVDIETIIELHAVGSSEARFQLIEQLPNALKPLYHTWKYALIQSPLMDDFHQSESLFAEELHWIDVLDAPSLQMQNNNCRDIHNNNPAVDLKANDHQACGKYLSFQQHIATNDHDNSTVRKFLLLMKFSLIKENEVYRNLPADANYGLQYPPLILLDITNNTLPIIDRYYFSESFLVSRSIPDTAMPFTVMTLVSRSIISDK